MSKSSLITILALIASVSAKPYIYSYGTLPYPDRTAEIYNPAAVAPLPIAYSSAYQNAYPAAYSAAYQTAYPAPYPAGYPAAYTSAYSSYPASFAAPLSAPLQLPSYTVEDFAALYNPVPAVAPVAPVASVAPVAPVAPLTYAPSYASPYSYVYKR